MNPLLDDLAQLAGLPDPVTATSGREPVEFRQQQGHLAPVEDRVAIRDHDRFPRPRHARGARQADAPDTPALHAQNSPRRTGHRPRSDAKVEAIWERHLNTELEHLHTAWDLMRRHDGARRWCATAPQQRLADRGSPPGRRS
ncbi:hypothetical protein CGZ69_00600 [Streptomyces peucetius subsp. caesius ATCC 27952]|nr:hypothetical protein CGZ69_00600 [Streptomyces peucetius subsp. caesius ATCC 27952]